MIKDSTYMPFCYPKYVLFMSFIASEYDPNNTFLYGHLIKF